MTMMAATNPAHRHPDATIDASSAASAPKRLPTSAFEIAALRADGSMYIGQDRAPALPLFESAFSAFARGTVIQTGDGPVAVEDLQPGDKICTATGQSAPLVWIGSSTFVPADTGQRMPLLRIMADSFGQGRPETFLTVGPAARLLQTPPHLRAETNGRPMLTPVRQFIDGVNVIEITPPTPVHLFHICLDRHAIIMAGGIEMETFHPVAEIFQATPETLRDRFLSMFPRIGHYRDFGPLAHPRAPETA